MIKKIIIIIMVVSVILAGISIAQIADNIKVSRALARDQARIEVQKEWWNSSNMMMRYHSKELKLKYYDEYYEKSQELITDLRDDLIVQEAAKLNAYEEIRKMAFFIETIEAIAEANDMVLPEYVTE